MNSNSNYLKYHDLLSPLYAQEWLKLKLQCEPFKFSSCTPQFLSIPWEMVELIINICLEFQLNSEIEFTALDLIDYYFMRYYLKLKKYNNMFKIQETIRKNGFLHIISAIIISTKYVERKFCSIDNLKIFLAAASSNFTINEIKSAEFYVFETIGFRVPEPIAYRCVECLLRKCGIILKSNTLHIRNVAIKLLRLVYLQRNEIYNRLSNNLIPNANKIQQLKEDKILLSASVVYASVKYMNVSKTISNKILIIISEHCKCNNFDIKQLGHIIYLVADSEAVK